MQKYKSPSSIYQNQKLDTFVAFEDPLLLGKWNLSSRIQLIKPPLKTWVPPHPIDSICAVDNILCVASGNTIYFLNLDLQPLYSLAKHADDINHIITFDTPPSLTSTVKSSKMITSCDDSGNLLVFWISHIAMESQNIDSSNVHIYHYGREFPTILFKIGFIGPSYLVLGGMTSSLTVFELTTKSRVQISIPESNPLLNPPYVSGIVSFGDLLYLSLGDGSLLLFDISKHPEARDILNDSTSTASSSGTGSLESENEDTPWYPLRVSLFQGNSDCIFIDRKDEVWVGSKLGLKKVEICRSVKKSIIDQLIGEVREDLAKGARENEERLQKQLPWNQEDAMAEVPTLSTEEPESQVVDKDESQDENPISPRGVNIPDTDFFKAKLYASVFDIPITPKYEVEYLVRFSKGFLVQSDKIRYLTIADDDDDEDED